MSMYSEDYVPDDGEIAKHLRKKVTMDQNNKALSITEDEATLAAIAATKNDLAMMTEVQRAQLYGAVCRSIGLNPLTSPFEYIKLNGKLTLYAKKGATDQIREIKGISITNIEQRELDGVLMVTATAQDANGRMDTDMGAVVIKGLGGEALANAHMKAITKAKRRVTLSMAGLGFLDESEMDTIPASRMQEAHVDVTTGEIHNAPQRPAQAPPKALIQKPAPPIDKPHIPPHVDEFYDALNDPMPEARAAIVQRYVLALQDAKMDENHRHAIAWAAGYGGTTTNVPSDVLEKWTRGIKSKPQLWKQTAEMRMVDMQAEQEQLNFQESAEYRDEDMDAAIMDIGPDEDTYDGEYEEVDDSLGSDAEDFG